MLPTSQAWRSMRSTWSGSKASLYSHKSRDSRLEYSCTLTDRDAILEAERSHLVDQPGTARDKLIPNAVKRLQVDLLDRPYLREAHGRSCHSLGDGFSVDGIVLLRLDVRLHELCRHDADLVPHRLQLARQPL